MHGDLTGGVSVSHDEVSTALARIKIFCKRIELSRLDGGPNTRHVPLIKTQIVNGRQL